MLHRGCISSRTGFLRSGLEFPCLLISVVFIVLGSLTPFRVDVEAFRSISSGGTLSFWPKCNAGDAFVNLFVYIPLGASLFALMRNRFRHHSSLILTFACGSVLSLGLELTQSILKGRYASLWDVLFNSIGTFLGAMLVLIFVRSIVRRLLGLRRAFHESPLSAVEAMVVFGLLILSVVPFDFVTTAKGLRESMQEARITVLAATMAGRPMLAFGVTSHSWSDQLAGDLGWAAAFGLLGYLFVVRNRSQGAGLWNAGIRSLGSGFLLAIVMEVLQLFASGHVFAAPDILVHGVGVLMGATLGVVREVRRRGESTNIFSNGLLAVVVLGQTLVILLPSWFRVYGAGVDGGAKLANWVPLADVLQMPFALAVARLADVCCVYALLIVPAYLWWSRLVPRWSAVLAVGLAMFVAGAAGLSGQGESALRFSTQVLAAIVASYGTICLVRFLVEDRNMYPQPTVPSLD